MKLRITTFILIVFWGKSSFSQSACINDSLLLYTDNAQWIISSNSYGAANGVNAYLASPQLNSIAGIPLAKWINYQTSWIMSGTLGQPDDSTIFSYDFKLCRNDSVKFDFTFRRDNYCKIKLDANIIFSEISTANPANYNIGNQFLNKYYLLSGVHSLEFIVFNTYPYTGNNGTGGIIGGYLVSDSNSLIQNIVGCSNATCCLIAPPIQLSQDTTLCAGQSATLSASGPPVVNWSGGIQNGVPFNPTTTTTYTVTGSDANGCSNTASVTITVLPAPTVTATANPPSVCTGDPVTLSGGGAIQYNWTGGISNGIPFVPSATTSYTVTGTDANTCTNTSAVTVNVTTSALLSITPTDPRVCTGDSLTLHVTGGSLYQWQPAGYCSPAGSPDPDVYPPANTVYTVTGTDANGCTGSTEILVKVVDPPHLTLEKSGDIECNVHAVTLTVSGAETYVWQPAAFLNNPNSANPLATVTSPTTFTVTGYLATCSETDSINVDIYNDDESAIYIPNAFSPNNDGLNDCFKIHGKGHYLQFYLAVYNRWGQRVFETNMATDCWDGTYDGKKVDGGTYFYYLKAETLCGKILRKGDIQLMY